jgi:dipeptidyl-peptidase 4
MERRYSRAVRLTAPKWAAAGPAAAVEGYWLDDRRYFFLAGQLDSSLDRVSETPSIADVDAQTVTAIVPLDVLAGLLTQAAGLSIDRLALSSAAFDMPNGNTLAVSVDGWDYLVDVPERRVRDRRPSFGAPALYSPDGRFACFVRGKDLWLSERATGIERALTTDGTVHNAYAQQPESALSAVSYRKRPYPVGLWSTDSRWFLTHRIDERSLPDLALIEHAPAGGGRPILHSYKYPMPGDTLPIATLVAFEVGTGRMVAFEEFPAPVLSSSPFFWRMAWFDGKDTAWFLRLDRYCRQAELIRLDLARGTGNVVLRESRADGYLEFHQFALGTPNVRTLAGSNEVVWYSEADGWGHLYLHDISSGALKNRITGGSWLVRDIVHVDEAQRRLLFTACGLDAEADPARRTLCSVNLDGSGFQIVLEHEGDLVLPKNEPAARSQDRPYRPSYANAGLSPSGRFGVVRCTSVERGDRTAVVDLGTGDGFVIARAAPADRAVGARPFVALAADGVTNLHGVMFLPSDFDPNSRYALIDYIYPGPQITWRPQSFASVNASSARALAEIGFVTIMLDTRGMPCRSRLLHQVGYGELLEPQLADHAAVVRQLCERHAFIDAGRIGVIGYSGGGAATARALLDYGDLFKVGVSVCGNHDNDLNIAFWSDKYRGPGSRESRGWQVNSAAAHKLTGKLLLISGDMDENVHVSQTYAFARALIDANRDFDLLIVPGEGHALLLASGYVQRRVWDYFVRHLMGAEPPEDFVIRYESHELQVMERCWVREARE